MGVLYEIPHSMSQPLQQIILTSVLGANVTYGKVIKIEEAHPFSKN